MVFDTYFIIQYVNEQHFSTLYNLFICRKMVKKKLSIGGSLHCEMLDRWQTWFLVQHDLDFTIHFVMAGNCYCLVSQHVFHANTQ